MTGNKPLNFPYDTLVKGLFEIDGTWNPIAVANHLEKVNIAANALWKRTEFLSDIDVKLAPHWSDWLHLNAADRKKFKVPSHMLPLPKTALKNATKFPKVTYKDLIHIANVV
jgi:hypothetical protein